MTDSIGYFTYRLAKLPHTIKNEHIHSLFNEDDRRAIISTSVGPCPHHPAAFNVATVTFSGERNLKKLASYYEQEFPSIRVDDNFHGLTPLNTIDGTSKAECGPRSLPLTMSYMENPRLYPKLHRHHRSSWSGLCILAKPGRPDVAAGLPSSKVLRLSLFHVRVSI